MSPAEISFVTWLASGEEPFPLASRVRFQPFLLLWPRAHPVSVCLVSLSLTLTHLCRRAAQSPSKQEQMNAWSVCPPTQPTHTQLTSRCYCCCRCCCPVHHPPAQSIVLKLSFCELASLRTSLQLCMPWMKAASSLNFEKARETAHHPTASHPPDLREALHKEESCWGAHPAGSGDAPCVQDDVFYLSPTSNSKHLLF